jgi:hypothetical protein
VVAVLEGSKQDCWFQQDEASVHIAKQQQLRFSQFRAWPFGHHVLLTSGRLILLGFLVESLYSNILRSLEDLKYISEHAFGGIYQQTLRKPARSTGKLVIACLHESWGHFQHML